MPPISRRRLLASTAALAAAAPLLPRSARAAPPADKASALAAMKRACAFMTDKVSRQGGYVWTYLPDFSRSWGEMEAYPSSIWIQPPGTPSMGHLFLDAYHATRDEQFYQAAEQTGNCLAKVQHPDGGWNYMEDLAGDASIRQWYATIGRNGWRLEEFQHYYGNGTFDDEGTSEASIFFLRLYAEKADERWRAPLEKALAFVLDSQYPIGGWPQRFPLRDEFHDHGQPDYTRFITFNDDVTSGNLKFLLLYYQKFGDMRVLGPIKRAMDVFLATQQTGSQPAWGMQHAPEDLKPAGARTYEPKAFVTHATGANIEQLMQFYEMTGDKTYLKRIPEALDWLDKVRLSPELAQKTGHTHPTFLEIGTDAAMYIHRRGSNVVNGAYYSDANPDHTLAHYSSFRTVNTDALRRRCAKLMASDPQEVSRTSPLKVRRALPDYFATRKVTLADLSAARTEAHGPAADATRAGNLVAGLNAQGFWPTPLRTTSHPYIGAGPATPAPGDFCATLVGDAYDTSPYHAENPPMGISTGVFIAHMCALITFLKPEAA